MPEASRRAGAQQNGGQRVLIAVQQLPSLVAGAAEQNAVHPLTNEKFKQPLDFAVPRAAAAKHHLIALLPGAGLNAQRERRVKGVGDVRQNQPQHIGAAGDEAPGQKIRAVALLAADAQHPIPGILADLGCVVECPGDRGNRDAGQPGNIFDCDMLHGRTSKKRL